MMESGGSTHTDFDDPDVVEAAEIARQIVAGTLQQLPAAESYDYGGHSLKHGEYDVCVRCTVSIAEAQQARDALVKERDNVSNSTVREHLDQAIQLFENEARVAELRARLHNGRNTEGILNEALAFIHKRKIHDEFDHSHHGNE